MVYTHNRILFVTKKEGNSRYNKDEPWGHCVKWNKPSTERYTLHTSIDTSKFRKTESKLFLPELEEGGNDKSVLNGCTMSALRWERAPQMDGGDSCPTCSGPHLCHWTEHT